MISFVGRNELDEDLAELVMLVSILDLFASSSSAPLLSSSISFFSFYMSSNEFFSQSAEELSEMRSSLALALANLVASSDVQVAADALPAGPSPFAHRSYRYVYMNYME